MEEKSETIEEQPKKLETAPPLPMYLLPMHVLDSHADPKDQATQSPYQAFVYGRGPLGPIVPMIQRKKHRFLCGHCMCLPSKAGPFSLDCTHLNMLTKARVDNVPADAYDGEKYPEDPEVVRDLLRALKEMYFRLVESRVFCFLRTMRIRSTNMPTEELESLQKQGEELWAGLYEQWLKAETPEEKNAFHMNCVLQGQNDSKMREELAMIVYLSSLEAQKALKEDKSTDALYTRWAQEYKNISAATTMLVEFYETLHTQEETMVRLVLDAFREYNRSFDEIVDATKATKATKATAEDAQE